MIATNTARTTAGIGEKAAAVRRAICAELGWLGIALDDTANAHHARRLDTGRGPRVCVVTADEEAEIDVALPEGDEWARRLRGGGSPWR